MPERRRIPVELEGIPRIPDDQHEPSEQQCDCPRLERAEWDDVESDWSDISFLKATTKAVFGVPVNYATTREALRVKAEAIGATIPEDAMLLLGSGQFRRPVLLEVEGVAPGTKGVDTPGGFAYTRLVSAPWGELPKRVKETDLAARLKYGRKPDDTWIWYLTCGACSQQRAFETLIVAHYRDHS